LQDSVLACDVMGTAAIFRLSKKFYVFTWRWFYSSCTWIYSVGLLGPTLWSNSCHRVHFGSGHEKFAFSKFLKYIIFRYDTVLTSLYLKKCRPFQSLFIVRVSDQTWLSEPDSWSTNRGQKITTMSENLKKETVW
jgi:hypothetical protein